MQKIVIRHLKGTRSGQVDEFPVSAVEALIIGRDGTASIRFDADREDLVSRQHAKIIHESSDPGFFQLLDLQSRNGTFLNRQRVYGSTRINHNDLVQLGAGGPEFRFEIDPPPSGAARPTREASFESLANLGSKATREAWPSVIGQSAGPRPIGRATVERMFGDAFTRVKRESNRLTWVGITALVAILAVGGGIWFFMRQSAAEQAAAQERNILTLQRMNEELKKNPAAAESMKQQIASLETELKQSDRRHEAAVQGLLKEINSRVEHEQQQKTVSGTPASGSAQGVTAGQVLSSQEPSALAGQSYDSLMNQATEQFQHGQPKKALVLVQLAIETDKTRWEGYDFAGQLAAMMDDKDTAMAMYRKAISLAPAENRQDIQFKLDDLQKKKIATN